MVIESTTDVLETQIQHVYIQIGLDTKVKFIEKTNTCFKTCLVN
jgi:hypothetical protein